MPCNASYARLLFLKVFHKYYNFICIFICTPICTKNFILAKSGCYTKENGDNKESDWYPGQEGSSTESNWEGTCFHCQQNSLDARAPVQVKVVRTLRTGRIPSVLGKTNQQRKTGNTDEKLKPCLVSTVRRGKSQRQGVSSLRRIPTTKQVPWQLHWPVLLRGTKRPGGMNQLRNQQQARDLWKPNKEWTGSCTGERESRPWWGLLQNQHHRRSDLHGMRLPRRMKYWSKGNHWSDHQDRPKWGSQQRKLSTDDSGR
jgi:hypothetical protein